LKSNEAFFEGIAVAMAEKNNEDLISKESIKNES